LLADKERVEEEFSWFVDKDYEDNIPLPPSDLDDHKSSRNSFETSDFVPLWQKNAQKQQQLKEGEEAQGHLLNEDDLEMLQDQKPTYSKSPISITDLLKLLDEERAKNIKVIDMRDKCDWTDWMIIAEGLSGRHLGNVADHTYSVVC